MSVTRPNYSNMKITYIALMAQFKNAVLIMTNSADNDLHI